MPTSKFSLAEQVKRRLAGGIPSRDVKVTIQELIIAVSQVFASAVKFNFFANKKEGEQTVDGSFIYSFDCQEVKKDTKRNLFYTVLPSATISLPNGIGINMVSLMQDQENAFTAVPDNFLRLTKDHPLSNLEGSMGYWRENNRIYYVNMAASDQVTEVLIKLLVGLDGIGDDDLIDIPLDIQHDIVERVYQMYIPMQQTPKDDTNNNAK